MSTSHRVAILSAPKAQHEIRPRTTPTISTDEVLIKITATAINIVDWKLRDDFGDVVTLLPAMMELIQVTHSDPQRPVRMKRVTGLGSLPEMRHLSEPLMKALSGEDGWLARCMLKPNKTELVSGGISALEAALERNKKGVSGIKIIIRPQE